MFITFVNILPASIQIRLRKYLMNNTVITPENSIKVSSVE
jgi:hypothetical protein